MTRWAPPGVFTILYVCTGNVCRSPYAELLTRQLLVRRLGPERAARFSVGSAGTHAHTGAAIHPFTLTELAVAGVAWTEAAGARRLDADVVRAADLVLTAERGHRSFVVDLEPAALRAVFCLREFARLAGALDRKALPTDPVARATAAVTLARGLRGTLSYTQPADDAVPDPIGQPPPAHRRAARMIAPAVHDIVDLVAPPQA